MEKNISENILSTIHYFVHIQYFIKHQITQICSLEFSNHKR